MKRKLVLTIVLAGVLVSIGFTKELQNTKVFAQTEISKVKDGQTEVNNGNQYRTISVEEQNRREGYVAEGKNLTTTISAEEQNMVEKSSAKQGFVHKKMEQVSFFLK
jgi:hypothetical protein